jgi:release factor glutamine methyltransferase
MKIKDYKIRFTESLSPIYDSDEIESFFFLILEQEHQLKRVDLALNPNLELTENELQKWATYLQELQKQKPIQYLLGKTQFFGLEFFVNEHTLIPRPETEELVSWIINDNQHQQGLNILDIGTGSGCIAISLDKNLKAETFAFDVSYEALEVAQKNADHNQAFVHLVEFDILNDVWEGDPFDIIVSNPPYVRELEKEEIKPNVLEYEPHLALFVSDENPLLFYEKIADFAKEHLSENGKLYFEINQYLGKETSEMLKNKGFKKVILKKDIYGNDRMILAY